MGWRATPWRCAAAATAAERRGRLQARPSAVLGLDALLPVPKFGFIAGGGRGQRADGLAGGSLAVCGGGHGC